MKSFSSCQFERSRKRYNLDFQCISTALNVTIYSKIDFSDSLSFNVNFGVYEFPKRKLFYFDSFCS